MIWMHFLTTFTLLTTLLMAVRFYWYIRSMIRSAKQEIEVYGKEAENRILVNSNPMKLMHHIKSYALSFIFTLTGNLTITISVLFSNFLKWSVFPITISLLGTLLIISGLTIFFIVTKPIEAFRK